MAVVAGLFPNKSNVVEGLFSDDSNVVPDLFGKESPTAGGLAQQFATGLVNEALLGFPLFALEQTQHHLILLLLVLALL